MKLAIALSMLLLVQDPAAPKPEPRDGNWMKRHEGFVAEAKQGGHDLLFLGDSITDAWRGTGRKTWDESFAPLHAVNFGISGDCTHHVLWRLQNGELDGFAPKLVVLMIGTNDIGWGGRTPEQAAAGVEAIVKEIRTRTPKARVLLLAVFPRGTKPDDPLRAQVNAINARIAKLRDGERVTFLDIGPKFLAPDGTLPADVMPDALHPNEKGYLIWRDAIVASVKALLKGA